MRDGTRSGQTPTSPRDAMIDHLMRLPYISYWLPVAVAVVAAAPLLYWLLRTGQPMVTAPAGTAPPGAAPDPDSGGASSEQRRSYRRGGNPISILFTRPGQNDNPLHASLVDRSLGGLCLLTHEAIPVGTVLAVRPANADEIVPWIEVEVCVCRPGPESYEVGCRFVKTPPYSILLLFG
jgi:PilZ domain